MTEMDIGGNVLEAVLHNPADFTVEHVVKFMLQVLEGLQQLHTRYHLVHTDLRAQYVYAGAVIPGLDKVRMQYVYGGAATLYSMGPLNRPFQYLSIVNLVSQKNKNVVYVCRGNHLVIPGFDNVRMDYICI